ncbi:MAG: NAD-dependent epimerase/dehydratase family protein [Oscillospiraceae bacterium]|nr:NAD-dependent epimerase/dehydratase family protein [Oscillospiraceae bacterium]
MRGLKVYNKSNKYSELISSTVDNSIEWDLLRKKSFLIIGASGLIGTFLIDILMFADRLYKLGITIYAISRNADNAKQRFNAYNEDSNFMYIKHDINYPLNLNIQFDYVIHGASNTHPIAYATDPIGTIQTNVIGTYNVLEFCVNQKSARVMYMSSVEIYGENRGDVTMFSEDYCGYIDSNTLRAGYPESKRMGEALCQAYIQKHKLDIVIPRFGRVFGPTMAFSDSKVIAQFIKNVVNKENIVLKSQGTQLYSFIYVADAVIALLCMLLNGKCGEAYNVSDEKSNFMLKDLASILANHSNVDVVYELPNEIENLGYSKATVALLDNTKLKELGWSSKFSINDSLYQTVAILSELEGETI